MVKDLTSQLEGQGYSVVEGPSFKNSCAAGRCRPDIIYRDQNGKLAIIEVKTGNADLSIRQSDIFPQIKDGNAIPTGNVAEKFDLRSGIPLKDQGYPNGIPLRVERFPGVK